MINAIFGVAILAGVVYQFLVDGTFFKIYLVCMIGYYLLTQVIFINQHDVTIRKKIMAATWGAPQDPTSYIPVDYDVTKTQQFLKKVNQQSPDNKITLTHIYTRAMGLAMSKNRREVGRIKWGNFQRAKEIKITVLVDYDGGKDLVPITITEPQKFNIIELAEEINKKVRIVKEKKDKSHNELTSMVKFFPSFLVGALQSCSTYLSQNCGWTIDFMKLRGNQWGHGVLTNIGSIGLEQGFAPIPCVIYPQFLICTGKTTKKPVVVQNSAGEDEIVIKPLITSVFTFDHRFGDASLALKFLKIIKNYVEDPETFNIDDYPDSIPYEELAKQKKNK